MNRDEIKKRGYGNPRLMGKPMEMSKEWLAVKSEELAHVIAFLSSELASYVNGINVPVDGGRTKSL